MHLALYQPDIAANTGTIIRLAACLATPLHIVEPAGFDPSDRAFRRAGLDYLDRADITRHPSFQAFQRWRKASGHRLVLLSTKAEMSYLDFAFEAHDILLLGRESSGVPQSVRQGADAALRIPIQAGLRSLNVALAGAMALGEALRQIDGFAD